MSQSATVAQLDAIILTLTEARDDAEKVDKGQSGAPGTRLRKAASTSSEALKNLRASVLEARK